MTIQLLKSTIIARSKIQISGSKSETNRLLLLQAIYPNLKLQNISNSNDSDVMSLALKNNQQSATTSHIDIHHAGTAMRFLTAFFATSPLSDIVLTGSTRMKERPIQILVDALQQLGANITYVQNNGFPPLKIIGTHIIKNKVSVPANISSQYISALLLVAPKLQNGLELQLEGKITSIPYIKMTLQLLNQIGVTTVFDNNTIRISPRNSIQNKTIIIESDWSSASYFYSIVAMAPIETQITLSSYKPKSLQGDSAVVEIYKHFGVETMFNENNTITIQKITPHNTNKIILNLNNCPDIAQTIAVTCFGLGISCELQGLHTLKIKETDRLHALKVELTKLGAIVKVTDDSLELQSNKNVINKGRTISTYQDHRMAMAFAPLALKTDINIENYQVVSKSYPNFWKDLKQIDININLYS